MPGLGLHLAVAKFYHQQQGREMSDEFILGTLVPDSWTAIMGGRHFSHFCGGAGCIPPQLDELATLTPAKVQKWGPVTVGTYIVGLQTDLRSFARANTNGGDYGRGLECHYVTDYLYNKLLRESIFDISHQDEGFLICRRTGEHVSGADFPRILYAMYPALEQTAFRLSGVTAADVSRAKTIVTNQLSPERAAYLCKDLRYDEKLLPWSDQQFFAGADFAAFLVQCAKFPEIMAQMH